MLREESPNLQILDSFVILRSLNFKWSSKTIIGQNENTTLFAGRRKHLLALTHNLLNEDHLPVTLNRSDSDIGLRGFLNLAIGLGQTFGFFKVATLLVRE